MRIIYLLLVLMITSCKQIKTDINGRKYYINDHCIKDHLEPHLETTMEYDGEDWHPVSRWNYYYIVCDSSRIDTVFVNPKTTVP